MKRLRFLLVGLLVAFLFFVKFLSDTKPMCDVSQCELPDCFCSIDGTGVPGSLSKNEIPQMILLTFDDNIEQGALDIFYNQSFKNPNGCSIKGTFFVSNNRNISYILARKAHFLGHEIAMHSITHVEKSEWENGSAAFWWREMLHSRELMTKYAKIDQRSIVGWKSPFMIKGGDIVLNVMEKNGFLYDHSVVSDPRGTPKWPYTAHYRTDVEDFSRKSYSGWIVPFNILVSHKNANNRLMRSKTLAPCDDTENCEDELYQFLNLNFDRHYKSNRAPFIVPLHWDEVESRPDIMKAFTRWIHDILSKHDDVFFVTMTQLIKWMRHPMSLEKMKESFLWHDKCNVDAKHLPFCEAQRCTLRRVGKPERSYDFESCEPCPEYFPWTDDLWGTGQNLETDNFDNNSPF